MRGGLVSSLLSSVRHCMEGRRWRGGGGGGGLFLGRKWVQSPRRQQLMSEDVPKTSDVAVLV